MCRRILFYGVVCLVVNIISSNLYAQSHFSSCAVPNPFSATVIVPSTITALISTGTLESSDEIAIFTPGGICAGVATWTGNSIAISIFSDVEETQAIEGLVDGEEMNFVVWDASEGMEYGNGLGGVSVLYHGSSTRTDGLYETDAIYQLASIEASESLPVELVSFEATADGQHVILAWETASETNNAGFEVQYVSTSSDAATDVAPWQALDFVEGHGTTLEDQAYQYRATYLEPGRHVFRLKQVDYDGTFEYSPEVEVLLELPEAFSLSAAYPNPFNPQTQFTLTVARSQPVSVAVYDVQGRLVMRLHDGVIPANEARVFRLDGANLPSGLYLIRALGKQFNATQKVMLQK